MALDYQTLLNTAGREPAVRRLIENQNKIAQALDAFTPPVAALTYQDDSGTPGNATQHTDMGRAAIAAAASAVTITNNKCLATSVVVVELEDADATLLYVTVAPGAGSFVITGNTTATANTKLRWRLYNAATAANDLQTRVQTGGANAPKLIELKPNPPELAALGPVKSK